FRRVADLENGVGFKQSAGQEETEEREEPRHQEAGHHGPHETSTVTIDLRGRSSPGNASGGCRLRGSYRRRANLLCGILRSRGRGFRRFGIRIDLPGLRLRHEL